MTNDIAGNKVALVTGGARRVGKAIVVELARAGYDVLVHYRSSTEEAQAVVEACQALGVKALATRADLTHSEEIERMFEAVDLFFGRIDVLVNSAAVFRVKQPWDLTLDDFDYHIQTNLRAPYYCSILAARRMREKGGCIVNIGDVAAERPFRDQVPYCISKAGLLMMTKAMAKAFAPAIRVNAVLPGTVLFRPDEDDRIRAKVTASIPLGKIGSPQDVAKAALFLIQAPHITGAALPVDGGRLIA